MPALNIALSHFSKLRPKVRNTCTFITLWPFSQSLGSHSSEETWAFPLRGQPKLPPEKTQVIPPLGGQPKLPPKRNPVPRYEESGAISGLPTHDPAYMITALFTLSVNQHSNHT